MFITFEGIDSCGKSTQARLLNRYFISKGENPIFVCEPGGTVVSKEIRDIVLNPKYEGICPRAEFLLYSASRAQLVFERIAPNLDKTIICDRYYDSSTAFQGYGRELNLKTIKQINSFATDSTIPDFTFLVDIPVEVALTRMERGSRDRIEAETKEFHQRVRKSFLTLAKKEKDRFFVLDGTKTKDAIFKKVLKILGI